MNGPLPALRPRRLLRGTAALLLALACLFPFAFLILLSLAKAWPFPDLLPRAVSLDLWARVLTGPSALGASFLLSCGLSLVVAFLSTAAGFVTGKFIAYHPKRKTLLFLAYVPFIMSPVILGTCLMYLYLKFELVGNAAGVALAQTMFAYGFSIVFFSAFWNPEVKALEDLVFTLGGSTFDAYRRVLIPVSKGMLLICFFQTFLISWFQYGLTLLIGAGKVQTLPIKVYDYVNEANIFYAAMASCLLILPPAALLWVNKRFVFNEMREG
jgi:putative spermidine/putrescine transport system permease protein